ncbi:hypothetical protein ACQP2E_05155 [Actinoplanes sp. CA-015351]|uniref:hypothetical protein n=1 Tax=Actinoplanes sp. CA-015351 TaxID=3239897 RepID=UPI003D985B30
MQKTRRFGAMIALATTAAGMAAVSAAAPAAAIGRGPAPVSNWLQAVPANTTSWVTINWRTDRPICDAQIRVRGEAIKVDYLGARRFTTFSRGDALRPGRTDFTKVRVTPIARRNSVTKLWATISYDECGWKARTQTRTTVLSLPVVARNTSPGGNGGPGGPGHGHSDGPGQNGPGAPGQGGPGSGHGGGQGAPGGNQGGQSGPGGSQGGSGGNQGGQGNNQGGQGGNQGGSGGNQGGNGGSQGGNGGGQSGHGNGGGGH